MPMNMDTSRSLRRLIRRLLAPGSDFDALRELLNLEFRCLDARELTDSATISDFLNTLAALPGAGDYIHFVGTHCAYFLLHNASLMHVGASPIARLNTLRDVIGALNAAVHGRQCHTDELSDGRIIASVSSFVDVIDARRIGDVPQPVPWPLSTFVCIDEIIRDAYAAYWLESMQPMATAAMESATDSTIGIIHRWLAATYAKHLLPKCTGNEKITVRATNTQQELARDLIMHHSALFESSGTEAMSTLLPLSKLRAMQVLHVYVDSANTDNAHVVDMPDVNTVLTFRDEDLNDSAATQRLFLLDYVIEALCHGVSHSCTHETVENFLRRATSALHELGNLVARSADVPRYSLSAVVGTRDALQSVGLGEQQCVNVRAALVASRGNYTRLQMAPWNGLREFLHLVDDVTQFAAYFYECLQHCSPTGSDHRAISEVLHRANVERNGVSATLGETFHRNEIDCFSETFGATSLGIGYGVEPPWKLPDALRIFVIQPPVGDIERLSTMLPSGLTRTMFWVQMHRLWNITAPVVTNVTVSNTAEPGDHISVTPDDITKFCKHIQVGDTEYDVSMVKNSVFATEFIRGHIHPMLHGILANEMQRNRAMFQLRWLITFAAEHAHWLQRIRRPLTLAYLEIVDITQQGGQPGTFLDLLDHFHEAANCIREVVPGATYPTAFLARMFTLHYGERARTISIVARHLMRDILETLEALYMPARLAAMLCHSHLNFEPLARVISIPTTASAPLRVPISIMCDTIAALEGACHQVAVSLGQLAPRLRAAHVDALALADDTERIRNHPLGIESPQPDGRELAKLLLACMKRYARAVRIVNDTCGCSLMRHFAVLYEPELLPTHTVQRVLQFVEGHDDPAIFSDSLEQPIPVHSIKTKPCTHDVHDWATFTAEDITAIRAICPQFPMLDDPVNVSNAADAIKRPYTASYDERSIEVNWDQYEHTVYLASDKDPPIHLSTINSLSDAILGK
uniref:Tegument protein n=1 Tax=Otarine gammaherpesvirus 4 TaxID=2801541 RepID=A0A889IWP2_9GAMA|nr:Tegument protein [Otarine gammaherpesvirus 4]